MCSKSVKWHQVQKGENAIRLSYDTTCCSSTRLKQLSQDISLPFAYSYLLITDSCNIQAWGSHSIASLRFRHNQAFSCIVYIWGGTKTLSTYTYTQITSTHIALITDKLRKLWHKPVYNPSFIEISLHSFLSLLHTQRVINMDLGWGCFVWLFESGKWIM